MEGNPIAARVERARELTQNLITQGIRAVGITMVDNAGVTRVKTVPVSLFERTVRFGIGLTPVFNVFLVNDHITASPEVGGPTGDLRLMPDPFALRTLAAQPGWAWAPTDQLTQEGEVFGSCQRSFPSANRPPKPPMSPATSGRYVERTAARIRSTASRPASMSTPARA